MQTITLICVGKLKEPFYRAAVEEYAKRLRGSCKLNIVELNEERLGDAPAPAQVAAALEREAERILSKVPKNAVLAALCIEGQEMSSEALAKELSEWAVRGTASVCFVIGGSFGLSERVKAAARLRLSLSPMTFPHHLARVMLLEQVYRAFQIQSGTKYHK